MKQVYDNLFQVKNKIVGLGFSYYPRTPGFDKQTWPKEPIVFGKPLSSLVLNPQVLNLTHKKQYPIFHEVELGVVIGKPAFRVPNVEALEYVGGYCLALDLTTRQLQDLRKESKGFFLCKGGDNFTPVSEFIPKDYIDNPDNVELELRLDGEIKQLGNTKELAFKIADQIAFLSQYMTLNPGDIILTGTPEGLSDLSNGQRITAALRSQNKVFASLDIILDIKSYD